MAPKRFAFFILFLFISSTSLFGTKVSADTTTGLVGFWNLNEGSGATAADASGNGKTGTLTNSPSWTAGKSGNGLNFNGINNYVATPVTLNGTKGSISVWVNTSATLTSGKLYTMFYGTDSGNSIALSFSGYGYGDPTGNAWNLSIRGSYGNTLQVVAPVSSNASLQQWHHIVATWDTNTGAILYVDGSVAGSTSGSTGSLTLSSQSISAQNSTFLGTIDEVRTYSRALSSSDVVELYGSTPATPTTPPGVDTTPPVISSVATNNITSTSANVTWATNEVADSYVEYGPDTSYGSGSAIDSTMVTSHTRTLTSLASATTYHYRVVSKDPSGNIGRSSDVTFTTLSSGTTPPPTTPTTPGPVGRANFSTMTPGVALDMGKYTPAYMTGCDKYPTSITDFSGFTYDSAHNKMLMFGGGHSATPRTDVDGLDLNSTAISWASEYPTTPLSAQVVSNYDSVHANWISTGHPTTRHTYDELVYAPNVGELIMLAKTNLGAWCRDPLMVEPNDGYIWHYNPVTKKWRYTSPLTWGGSEVANGAEYDPVSGNVIGISRYDLIVYNPISGLATRYAISRPEIGISGELVYYPPNQKMYMMLPDGSALEIALNRSDYSKTVFTDIIPTGATRPFPVIAGTASSDGETGWAYDTQNRIIGGGVADGVFYAFDPSARTLKAVTMTTSSGNAVGSLMRMHTIDYDTADNVFVFMTQWTNPLDKYGPTDYRTWAYKYNGGAATPPTTPPTTPPVTPTDTTPPSIPSGLVAALATPKVNLSWNASTDNVAVTGYKIYRNGSLIATSVTTSYSDTASLAAGSYTYTVSAYDAAGNNSSVSTGSTVTITGTPTVTAPVISFSASPISITTGSSATLAWSVTGSPTCTASVGWAGSKAASGTLVVTPSVTTTYTLVCSNTAGSDTKSVTISVGSGGTGINAGLVGYWALDSVSGVGTLDYSGNNNLGVLTNSPLLVTGKIGNALRLNGTNSYVATPVTVNNGKGSVSLWVNPAGSLGTSKQYYAFNAESGGNYIRLYSSTYSGEGNPWTFRIRGAYGNDLTVTSPVASNAEFNRWQHLVVTWDINSGINIYVDGVLKGSLSGTTGNIATTDQSIGYSVNTLLGTIDEVRTYDRVLSPSDVALLYASTAVATPPTGPDTLPPTVPARLAANPSSQTTMEVYWKASADNTAVTGYKVYRNGVLKGTVSTPGFTDTGLSPSTSYSYTVSAFDAAGNISALTPSVTAPTSPAPVPLVSGSNGTIPGPGPQPIISEKALRLSQSPYSGATWYDMDYEMVTWKHPGGDWRDKSLVLQGNNPWATASVVDNDTEQKLSFDVTSLVQNQLGTSASKIPNRGWLVRYQSGSAIPTIYTKENGISSKSPVLHVVTSTGTYDIPVGDDVGMNYSSVVPNGEWPNQVIASLGTLGLWFDLNAIPGTLTSATLILSTTNLQYGGASALLGIYPVDVTQMFPTIPLQSGIASNYTNDINLEKDPSVLFMERYPDLNMDKRGWNLDTSLKRAIIGDSDPDDSNYVPLAPGIKSYKMTVPKDEFGGEFGRWLFWSNLGYEPEEVYIRTYARMGTNFDSMGGKFPFGFDGTYIAYPDWSRNPATNRSWTRPDAPDYAGNGGSTSNGTNGWSARGGYWAQDCSTDPICLPDSDPKANPIFKAGYRQIDYYSYWADQPDVKGTRFLWENGLLGTIPKNKWFEMEQYIKLNTVNADGTGNKDGILRVWIDGRLAYENTEFRTRNWPGNYEGAKNIKLYSLWLNLFNGGLLPANSKIDVYMANTVISKSYVGPSNLTGAPAIPPTVSNKFSVGDAVSVASTLNVRSAASLSGSLLGTQVTGVRGIVAAGPINADGINWWNINYDKAPDGWSSEDYLNKYIAPITPPVTPPVTPPATTTPPTTPPATTTPPVVPPATTTPPTLPTLPTVSIELTAVPATITYGSSAIVTWFATNAINCTASGAWSGPKPTSGTSLVTPKSDATYTLTCNGSNGTDIESIKITVLGAPTVPAPTPLPTVPPVTPVPTMPIGMPFSPTPTPYVPTVPPIKVNTPAVTPTFAVTLAKGAKNSQVATLQAFLLQRGLLASKNVTGTFDSATEVALGKYQCRMAIVCTPKVAGYGVLGPKTRLSINAELKKSISIDTNGTSQNTNASTTRPFTLFPRSLYRGLSGSDVYVLQTYLSGDPGITDFAPTGTFGIITENAVKQFQVRYGVITNPTFNPIGYGVFGRATQAKFNEVYNVK